MSLDREPLGMLSVKGVLRVVIAFHVLLVLYAVYNAYIRQPTSEELVNRFEKIYTRKAIALAQKARKDYPTGLVDERIPLLPWDSSYPAVIERLDEFLAHLRDVYAEDMLAQLREQRCYWFGSVSRALHYQNFLDEALQRLLPETTDRWKYFDTNYIHAYDPLNQINVKKVEFHYIGAHICLDVFDLLNTLEMLREPDLVEEVKDNVQEKKTLTEAYVCKC